MWWPTWYRHSISNRELKDEEGRVDRACAREAFASQIEN